MKFLSRRVKGENTLGDGKEELKLSPLSLPTPPLRSSPPGTGTGTGMGTGIETGTETELWSPIVHRRGLEHVTPRTMG